ncbi:hypothetical protein Scep_031063 [Stephania cephalantha]|uniref:Uncharacterized protein ycf68 n=1 Tax=Stephania cephalantha TaxID=152367 RepID=A0AAP0E1L1_9MAGN
MWIIQGTLAGVLLLFEPEFETKLLLRRIDGAIRVRSNVDPTFYSLVGSGRSGGDHCGSSLLENPYIPYQCMDSYLSSTAVFGGELLSIVGLDGRISRGGLRGGGLPCGGCQRFESAYLQLVNLADTKVYDSTQFCRFGSSIYDLSFMDVDKILPFSSTLGWHSLKVNVNGEVQTRKGLRWIPRHPETRKGVASDEMLRGVENKHRSGDSRIGQPFELLLNPWAGKRQPGELKHLSSQRKRKQKRFP